MVGEPGTIDPYGYWRGVREIDEAGAILVRPDGYVAWRQTAAVWDDDEALRQLTDALRPSWLSPSTRRPTAPDAPEYSTQSFPSPCRAVRPAAGETVTTSGV